MATYYGGKNHLYHALINLIPRHARYVEPFAGSAAVARNLDRRDAEALVLERDPEQAAKLRMELPGHRVICGDALPWLEAQAPTWGPDTVVFADPPYPLEDRRDCRHGYKFEMTADDHHRLARVLLATRARVLVCGHPWGLYAEIYRAWRRHEFRVTLRSGKPGVECVWTNYDDPYPLHDYRYFGDDKRVRQDLRRQVERQRAKFSTMERHQRAAVLRALVDEFGIP